MNSKPYTPNPPTLNPEPSTLNPQPQTPNPNPETRTQVQGAVSAPAEIGILLPNNQRQDRTLHLQKNVLPYALCNCARHLQTLVLTAAERTCNTMKGFKDFCLKAKARIWSRLSYMCRVRSTAALNPKPETRTQVQDAALLFFCIALTPRVE